MADNAYDTSSTTVAPVAPQIAGGASDSPFAFGGDPNAPGMLGMSRGFWRDIASFSANLGAAANARTAGGFLANGTGFAGPLAVATQETLAQGQKNATAQSALNQSGAQTADLRAQAAQRNIQNKVSLYNLNRNNWLYGVPQLDGNGNPIPVGSPSAPFQDSAPGQTPPVVPQGSVAPQSSVAPQPSVDKYAQNYGDPTDPKWAAQNLTTVTTPSGAKFTVNKAAAPAFSGFLSELEQSGYPIDPITSVGYGVRNITGGTTLSPHAYGVAVDINPGENPYSKTPNGGTLSTNLPPNVSAIAAKYGLSWGGDWKSLKDPMHFEYVGGKPVQVAQAGNVATDAIPSSGASGIGSARPAPAPGTPVPATPAPGTPAPATPAPAGAVRPPIGGAPRTAAPQMSQADTLALTRNVLQGKVSLGSLTAQQAGAIAPFITMVNPALGEQLSKYSLAGPQRQAETAAQVPEGYRMTPQGLVPTPGGPHDPATLSAQKGAETAAVVPEGYTRTAEGLVPTPGGPADPATRGSQKGAETAAETANKITVDRNGNIFLGTQYLGRGSEVKMVWDQNTQSMHWGDVGGIGIGQLPPGKYDFGPQAQANPGDLHFQETRGAKLGDQFDKIDADAAQAVESNYLFDNLRTHSQTWGMGKFADIEADARAWLSAVAHTFGNDNPGLDKPLADYQSWNKSAGQLLRTAVHDTSSRAAVQEYNLIGETLPHATTSEQGFNQIADQWQGLSDYRIAKQRFAQGYEGRPRDFNVEFNANVSPTSFMLNRMSQSEQGKADMAAMFGKMQESPEGRLQAARMQAHYRYAKEHKLFDGLPTVTAPATQP